MRNNNVLNLRRSLPCMSWHPKNLYNLWKRTVGPRAEDLTFKVTNEDTVFQQRWKSKAAVRAYHGDFIPEKVFKRWYLPATLPDVRPRRAVFASANPSDDKEDLEVYAQRKLQARQREKALEEEIEEKGMAPVGSLMFVEVERRLDVFLFRCCFVHSVYEARRLIIHGYVKLNGRKHSRANTRLAPGDLVSVDPDAMRFFKPPHGPMDDIFAPNSDRENKQPLQIKTPDEIAIERVEAGAAAMAEAERAAAEADAAEVADEAEGAAAEEEEASTPAAEASIAPEETQRQKLASLLANQKEALTPFYLPQYASPWLYIPAYIEVSFKTCSAVYVRHPTARPGYSEIPTPYDADGALVRYAWEWYMQRRPRMRSTSQMKEGPEDRVITVSQALHRDWTRTIDPGWTIEGGMTETEAGRQKFQEKNRLRAKEAAKQKAEKQKRALSMQKAAEGRAAKPQMN